jgi:hypothetical protein
MRRALEHRVEITLVMAGGIALAGLRLWPFPSDNVFLAAIATRTPRLFDGFWPYGGHHRRVVGHR